jgi:hypothetical protein
MLKIILPNLDFQPTQSGDFLDHWVSPDLPVGSIVNILTQGNKITIDFHLLLSINGLELFNGYALPQSP